MADACFGGGGNLGGPLGAIAARPSVRHGHGNHVAIYGSALGSWIALTIHQVPFLWAISFHARLVGHSNYDGLACS